MRQRGYRLLLRLDWRDLQAALAVTVPFRRRTRPRVHVVDSIPGMCLLFIIETESATTDPS